MSKYTRGSAFEYRVAKYLRSLGWSVFRSAGSHSTFDLIAIKPGFVRPLFIQCKASPILALTRKEKRELKRYSLSYKIMILIIHRESKSPYNFIYVGIKHHKFIRVKEPSWLK